MHGCDAVYDYQGDCEPRYRATFVFDYNMLEADAFASQVGAVNLTATNVETGQTYGPWVLTNEQLRQAGYEMTLPLTPGRYEFQCWAGDGVIDESQFSIDAKTRSCAINASEDGTVMAENGLKPLFHGIVTAVLPDAEGLHTVTVPLVKNTNYLSVTLVKLWDGGQEMSAGDYDVTITSTNGEMGRDNSLLGGKRIYKPFMTTAHQVESKTDGEGIMAELVTGRIMARGDDRLEVKKAVTGESILSLPLSRFLTAVKPHYNKVYEDQEYLDRQDSHALVFFMKSPYEWQNAYIYVNSWKVVLQNTEL